MTHVSKRENLAMKRRMSLMNQHEVAAKLGISQSQYSNIELGYAHPNEDQANSLIEMFGLPNDYFDGGNDKDGVKSHS